MKYVYAIEGTTNSGKPSVHVKCEHCGMMDFNLQAQIYSACLKAKPRQDMERACAEFFNRLNAGDESLFKMRKTTEKIMASLCHCDPDCIDLDRQRSIRRAQAILQAGLAQLRDK